MYDISLMSIFRLYPGSKMSFGHKSVRKSLFLSACFCWDSRQSLREIDQKFNFGGKIGYGDSYWDSVFRYSKVFSLHAILHDATGAVRFQSGKGHGYCYMIGRDPNCCLLSQVTEPIFCLYLKVFQPSFFNLIDFWIKMCLIVLDIELTEKNKIKELGLFIDGSPQRFSFCPPKTFKSNKQTTWNTRHLHGIAWSSGKLEYDKLFAVFYDIKVRIAEVFAKRFEKCRLLTRLLGQKVENLDDYGCPKIQVQQDTFYFHQSYEQVNFYKKQHFFISGWIERFWWKGLNTWVVESWNISVQVWQNLFFLWTP